MQRRVDMSAWWDYDYCDGDADLSQLLYLTGRAVRKR